MLGLLFPVVANTRRLIQQQQQPYQGNTYELQQVGNGGGYGGAPSSNMDEFYNEVSGQVDIKTRTELTRPLSDSNYPRRNTQLHQQR